MINKKSMGKDRNMINSWPFQQNHDPTRAMKSLLLLIRIHMIKKTFMKQSFQLQDIIITGLTL